MIQIIHEVEMPMIRIQVFWTLAGHDCSAVSWMMECIRSKSIDGLWTVQWTEFANVDMSKCSGLGRYHVQPDG